MEAKGTIMTGKQINQLERDFDYKELASQRMLDAYLLAQAKKSFKIGYNQALKDIKDGRREK